MPSDNREDIRPDAAEQGLGDYIRIIAKYKKMIAVIFFITVLASVGMTFIMKPEYESSASMMVIAESKSSIMPVISQAAEMMGMNLSEGSSSLNIKAILQSRRVALEVADKLDLKKRLSGKSGKKMDSGDIYYYLSKKVVFDDSVDGIIKIKAMAPEAAMSAEIANEYTATLQTFLKNHSASAATRNRKFIEGRLEKTRKRLEGIEDERRIFLEKNEITSDPTVDLKAEFDIYSKLVGELSMAIAYQDGAKARRKSMSEKGMTEEGGEPPSIEIYNDPAVQNVRSLLVDKEVEMLNARQLFQPDNKRIKIIQDEIDSLKSRLTEEIRTISHTVTLTDDVEYMTMGAKIDAYRSIISRFESKFAKMPGVSTGYLRLLRQVQTQTTIYSMLTGEYEKAMIEEARNKSEIEVLDNAVTPKTRTRPKKKLIVAVSGVLGLFAGIFLAFLLDSLAKSYEKETTIASRR